MPASQKNQNGEKTKRYIFTTSDFSLSSGNSDLNSTIEELSNGEED